MTRRKYVCIALTALVALLTACGGGGGDEAGTDDAATDAATEAGAGGETEAADGGEVSVPDDPSSGVTASEIKIGWMGDLTGPTASAQSFNARGTAAYFDCLNEQGGVLGRDITFLQEDDQFVAENAVSNYRKLIDDEQVLALTGFGGAHISEALVGDVERDEITVVGPPQTIDPQIDHPYIFNNIAHYGDQADVAIPRFAEVLDVDPSELVIAVVQLELSSGDEWNAYIKETLEAAGGTYAGRITVNPAQPDFAATVSQLQQLVNSEGVNAIALHGAPAHGLGIATEMASSGLTDLPIIGIHGIAGTTIYQEGPQELLDQIEGIHSFLPATGGEFEVAQEMTECAESTGNEDALLHINFSHGYLDGMIIKQAIERAAETGTLNRETFHEAMQGTFDTGGITCPIDWSSSNHSPCATSFHWNAEEENLQPAAPFDRWADEIDGEYGLAGAGA